jgi:hypothetical protein
LNEWMSRVEVRLLLFCFLEADLRPDRKQPSLTKNDCGP